MLYSFKRIFPTEEDWKKIESSCDSTCYHSKKWSDYLKRIGYHMLILKVFMENKMIGYFVGEKMWRGVTLIASPYDGIGTYTQGLVMLQHISKEKRVEIYYAMAQWIVKNRIASYFQVDDWQLREDSAEWDDNKACSNSIVERYGFKCVVRPTLYVSVNKSVEELWAGLHYKSCKYCINKANKLGLSVKVVNDFEDIQEFVNVHYDQLREVCMRKGMKPKAAQAKKRMLALCQSLYPDRVLMVKVVGNDERGIPRIMSSGIFCIDQGECSYWTGASYQRYQKYCPNELMVWEAMRILNELGAGELNFCGMADYKRKFGTSYAYVPRLIYSKYKWVIKAKDMAKRIYYKSRHLVKKS